jgi:hypothetical protein
MILKNLCYYLMSINFEAKFIKIYHRKVRAFTFITTDGEKDADEQIELFKNNPEKIKNIVPNSKIVDVSKIKVNKIFGIKITTLNIDYMFTNYNIKQDNIIHLVDSLGENADKCFLTNEKIPYKFRIF